MWKKTSEGNSSAGHHQTFTLESDLLWGSLYNFLGLSPSMKKKGKLRAELCTQSRVTMKHLIVCMCRSSNYRDKPHNRLPGWRFRTRIMLSYFEWRAIVNIFPSKFFLEVNITIFMLKKIKLSSQGSSGIQCHQPIRRSVILSFLCLNGSSRKQENTWDKRKVWTQEPENFRKGLS